MRTIDADAHVIETLYTWQFMDEAERKYAPAVLNRTSGSSLTTSGAQQTQHWLIDGRSTPKDIVNGPAFLMQAKKEGARVRAD